jgi:hypothetical protein
MATTSEAVEQYLASLRARHAPTNTIKAYQGFTPLPSLAHLEVE